MALNSYSVPELVMANIHLALADSHPWYEHGLIAGGAIDSQADGAYGKFSVANCKKISTDCPSEITVLGTIPVVGLR